MGYEPNCDSYPWFIFLIVSLISVSAVMLFLIFCECYVFTSRRTRSELLPIRRSWREVCVDLRL